jgi:hypothetical protein
MTRSVNELRRESELSRAELAATVSQLKVRITDTAEDIRHKASPQHIKAEVSDYISYKTQTWFESLKQRAIENPMQAIAVGAAIAAPALRMARTSSLPLLMVGAGLALTSKTVGDVAERAQGLGANLRDGLASATTQAADMAKNAKMPLPALPTMSAAVRPKSPETLRTKSAAAWRPLLVQRPRPGKPRRQPLQKLAISLENMPR